MTKLLYLNEQQLSSAKAQGLALMTENETYSLELDQTIFYPQGGGQPCDQGIIRGPHGELTVNSVKKENGTVIHSGTLKGLISVGEPVTLTLDTARRQLHSRLQSAGHVIDACLFSLGVTNLKPSKGYHFPDGPYDEFIGTVEDPEQLKKDIEKQAAVLILENRPVEIRFLAPALAQQELGFVPAFVPANENIRLVQIYGFPPIPCGGTHVKTLGEIGALQIRKVSSKKGFTRIAYALAKKFEVS